MLAAPCACRGNCVCCTCISRGDCTGKSSPDSGSSSPGDVSRASTAAMVRGTPRAEKTSAAERDPSLWSDVKAFSRPAGFERTSLGEGGRVGPMGTYQASNTQATAAGGATIGINLHSHSLDEGSQRVHDLLDRQMIQSSRCLGPIGPTVALACTPLRRALAAPPGPRGAPPLERPHERHRELCQETRAGVHGRDPRGPGQVPWGRGACHRSECPWDVCERALGWGREGQW